jgi:hypothetical protein
MPASRLGSKRRKTRWQKQTGSDRITHRPQQATQGNPKYKRKLREPWTEEDVQLLRAKGKTGVLASSSSGQSHPSAATFRGGHLAEADEPLLRGARNDDR